MTIRPVLRVVRRVLPLSALIVAACSASSPDTGAATTAAPARAEFVELTEAQTRNSGITIESVQTQTRSDEIVAPGLLALDEMRTARIGSLQEGLILETLTQVGDRVRARQILATMHGHAMHDAWAGYQKANADQRRLEKELAYAIDAHERAQRLYTAKALSLREVNAQRSIGWRPLKWSKPPRRK